MLLATMLPTDWPHFLQLCLSSLDAVLLLCMCVCWQRCCQLYVQCPSRPGCCSGHVCCDPFERIQFVVGVRFRSQLEGVPIQFDADRAAFRFRLADAAGAVRVCPR